MNIFVDTTGNFMYYEAREFIKHEVMRKEGIGLFTKLRKLRKYHELTINDMAELLGIDPRTYINKEKGISQFKANEMFIISRKFNKTIDEIFLPDNFMNHEVDGKKGGDKSAKN